MIVEVDMYKNIIFDMGNVLIDFSPMQYVGKLNLNDRAEEEKIFKAAYMNFKSIYMDYGRITEDEFVDHVVKGIGEEYRDKIRELIVNWSQYLTPIEGMEELVKELKDKGYKIYLLSNAGFSQHDYWEKIPASKYFDGKIVSCDVGEVKPFKEMVNKHNLLKHEALKKYCKKNRYGYAILDYDYYSFEDLKKEKVSIFIQNKFIKFVKRKREVTFDECDSFKKENNITDYQICYIIWKNRNKCLKYQQHKIMYDKYTE